MADAAARRDDGDEIERAVDEVLEAAGGDVRRAISGLIRGQQEIAAEVAKAVSAGYVRRRLG
ncbi:hypothetical protein [Consotaella salsifontis]|uniref:Uncharacterized protein n=1 Tax=Consotaella salsifontis TaxID=1365950 RepID=A0A1T4S329_9HYPH|nr:hypothetical protein [Consotaella salsifontis]SKA22633.1 hypothetical protein SAMN05428963_108220 [Consotaella salsifontis]